MASLEARPATRTPLRTSLLWLEAVLAVGAYAGAAGLPTGSRSPTSSTAGSSSHWRLRLGSDPPREWSTLRSMEADGQTGPDRPALAPVG